MLKPCASVTHAISSNKAMILALLPSLSCSTGGTNPVSRRRFVDEPSCDGVLSASAASVSSARLCFVSCLVLPGAAM